MKIVIVGGGTAGWVSAYLISFLQKFHQVTVIDSSKIGILGVGESTTGFFTNIVSGGFGIDFYEFVKECDATLKMGVTLEGWSNHKPVYYSPIDGSITNQMPVDISLYYAINDDQDVSNCNPFSYLMSRNKVQWDKNTNQRNFGLGALHIDTFKTNKFFKTKSIQNQVKHIDSIVEDVILNESGFIEKLILSDKTEISADFFIDASGFSRKLISNFDSKYISFKDHLPVNKAISFVLDKNPEEDYASVTTALAMSSGWMWKIPTRDRYGMGYVYCDEYISDDEALTEIELTLGKSIVPGKIHKFESGRLDKYWNKNCLCIGVAASFLEPLQATSIHTTILQIYEFISIYLKNTFDRTYSEASTKIYNKTISSAIDSFKDFVSCHYGGGKTHTDFWKNIKLTENAQTIVDLSKHKLLRRDDINSSNGFAGYELWSYTLEGNGVFSKEKTQELFDDNPGQYEMGKEFYNNFYNTMENKNKTLFTAKEFDNFIRSK